MKIISTVFPKSYCLGQMGHFGSENAAPSNFINGLTSNFDFWNEDMLEWQEQGVLMGFLKKLFLGKWAILGPENGASS